MRRTFYFIIILSLIFLVSLSTSCRKFDGDQTIPAFIRIDTISLTSDYFTEGANTHNISDAWVYVNDQIIGAFELPALIPVLAKGTNKLEIRPGIKLNGISSTRAPYPFYKPFITQYDVNIMHHKIKYNRNIRSSWIKLRQTVCFDKHGIPDRTLGCHKRRVEPLHMSDLHFHASFFGQFHQGIRF